MKVFYDSYDSPFLTRLRDGSQPRSTARILQELRTDASRSVCRETDHVGVEMVRRSVLSIVLACATACGGSGDNPISPSTTGTLVVMLTDSPFSDARALFVTFQQVSVHRSGGAFETLPFVSDSNGVVPPSRTCDLKRLATATDVLGVGALEPGHFTQLRLVVASAVIYDSPSSSEMPCAFDLAAPADGSSEPVTIPSNEIKLNREFDVTAHNTTEILLDFDGDRSVKRTGNGTYRMTPVIAVVSIEEPASP